MRIKRLFSEALGFERTVIEKIELSEAGDTIIVHVRPDRRWSKQLRCGVCGSPAPGYDNGDGRRRWRTLDLGAAMTFVESQAPRVECAAHGVVVAAVPWARHRASYTRHFEELVAWLAAQCSMSAVAALMRVTWRAVVGVVERAVAAAEERHDRLDGLRRIGIDEISHPKGQRYLTVVLNQDTGELVWMALGRDEKTVARFFEALGAERSLRIEAVSADGAAWIRRAVRKYCPAAMQCLDPFHVVAWATDALDEVRRKAWNDARRSGNQEEAKALKNARYALWKDRDDLTPRQEHVLRLLEEQDGPVWRAYVLKDDLRELVHLGSGASADDLDDWIARARTSGLAPFEKLANTIERHHEAIEHTLRLALSNARVESLNTKLRALMRRAFGFHASASLIRMALHVLGGGRPRLRASV